jgi:hypothetical protein
MRDATEENRDCRDVLIGWMEGGKKGGAMHREIYPSFTFPPHQHQHQHQHPLLLLFSRLLLLPRRSRVPQLTPAPPPLPLGSCFFCGYPFVRVRSSALHPLFYSASRPLRRPRARGFCCGRGGGGGDGGRGAHGGSGCDCCPRCAGADATSTTATKTTRTTTAKKKKMIANVTVSVTATSCAFSGGGLGSEIATTGRRRKRI